MLTRREKQCIDVIRTLTTKNGYSPSYDEILKAMGLKSKSSISRLTNQLVDKGYVKKLPGRSRSIALIDQENGCISSEIPFLGKVSECPDLHKVKIS